MSWWDTGHGSDVIGDQPSDMIRSGLARMVEQAAKRDRPKPTLAELLQAIGAIARQGAGGQLAETSMDLLEIIVELKSGGSVSSGPLRHGAPFVKELVGPLDQSVREMGDAYQQRWQRKPRLSEWLETLAFVLRYRPEQYLRDGVENPPQSIRAVGDSG